jgi:kynurenine formamidase
VSKTSSSTDLEQMQPASSHPSQPSEDEVESYFTRLSNWGRWGRDDTLGTLNLITDDARRKAAALVRDGIAVSCGWDIRPNQPSANAALGTPPQRYMTMTCNEPFEAEGRGAMAAEWFGMLFHGLEVTHLDALSHMAWDGRFYNGLPVERQTPTVGARDLAVTDAARGIIGRGVLLDIPALSGRRWLEPGEAVRPEQLDEACARQHVDVEPGDIMLLHTGFARRRRQLGMRAAIAADGYPGWHASTLPWVHEHQVAAIAADTANDARPSGYKRVPNPVHYVGIVAMGLWLIDNCDLDELVDTCARLDRWTFLFTVSGLRLRGGTGSPVNPIALL